MTPLVLLLTHHACLGHENFEDHPECPDRLRAVLGALEAEEFAGLLREVAPAAAEAQLLLAHSPEHVARILSTRPLPGRFVPLDGDTGMNHASAEAALRAAGAGVAAVDAVCAREGQGGVTRAFCAVRPPGHHAEPERAMGFCFFGNAVIAARHAQRAHGLGRVAILDFDVHHGNGTQAAVGGDPSILFASTHQSPCYPFTGAAAETGVGNLFNAPLPPGSGSAEFRAAWAETLLPAVERFAPELIVISAGFDAHARDPLAQLRLREADFGWLTAEICRIADRCCGGRVVSMLEGGYDLHALAASTAAHLRALMA
ncbi:histone deacetylase family protein [Pseudoroseomonas ludipueritiae]|uniref:Histone deacetylase family protein n=1 Tax=Pseudoroseomonas ludipueritiae TaxID=198093 RepID=A0ABR7RDA9_9PROT|nr:histone deacetylase family protein [Pseudoroseomonas ludipueritiae]MBC9179631.1 histone deacetylase family protein [Pseudoroseomonas ludipueritiae]MCG7362903.1 histone deacetylase family protein [Roseomonas sp. ACRSG]